jgi:hypothetical protein
MRISHRLGVFAIYEGWSWRFLSENCSWWCWCWPESWVLPSDYTSHWSGLLRWSVGFGRRHAVDTAACSLCSLTGKSIWGVLVFGIAPSLTSVWSTCLLLWGVAIYSAVFRGGPLNFSRRVIVGIFSNFIEKGQLPGFVLALWLSPHHERTGLLARRDFYVFVFGASFFLDKMVLEGRLIALCSRVQVIGTALRDIWLRVTVRALVDWLLWSVQYPLFALEIERNIIWSKVGNYILDKAWNWFMLLTCVVGWPFEAHLVNIKPNSIAE